MEPFLNPAQTVTDLREAVAYLKEHPWGQGEDYDQDTGEVCAHGAIRIVVGGLVLDPQAPYGCRSMDIASLFFYGSQQQAQAIRRRDRTSNAARAFYRVIGSDIAKYNDCEGRTKEQMIRALETVANALEEDPRRA